MKEPPNNSSFSFYLKSLAIEDITKNCLAGSNKVNWKFGHFWKSENWYEMTTDSKIIVIFGRVFMIHV